MNMYIYIYIPYRPFVEPCVDILRWIAIFVGVLCSGALQSRPAWQDHVWPQDQWISDRDRNQGAVPFVRIYGYVWADLFGQAKVIWLKNCFWYFHSLPKGNEWKYQKWKINPNPNVFKKILVFSRKCVHFRENIETAPFRHTVRTPQNTCYKNWKI